MRSFWRFEIWQSVFLALPQGKERNAECKKEALDSLMPKERELAEKVFKYSVEKRTFPYRDVS